MGSSPPRIHLLHVDDEPDLSEMTAAFLKRTDDRFSIDTATSASEGEALLLEHDYDCVVSDYDMPDRDGVEFLKTIRQTNPDLPFILYTGKGSEEVASEAIAAGVTDYLQKERGTSQYEVLANRIRNVVEQRQSKEEVSKRESRTNRLLEHSSDYLFVTDESGRITYVSPSIRRVLGYEPDEITGENAFEFVHPDDIETATEAVGEIVECPQEEVTVEFRALHADGGYRWLEIRGRNLFDDPVIEGILVNARDISQRKEREDDLRQFKKEYETVFDTAQDAIFLFDVVRTGPDVDFELRRLNPTHEALSGLSTAADSGKTPTELLGEETGREVAENYRRCVRTGETISYRERLDMPAGVIHWDTKLGPVIEDGDVTQIVGVAREVGEPEADIEAQP